MKGAQGHGSDPRGGVAHQAGANAIPALYPHADLSANKLQAAYARQQMENSRLGDEMIAAGRGYEKPSETRTKSDDLSQRVNAAADRHIALVTEMRRRERFSGSLKLLPSQHRQSFLAG